VQLDVCPAGHGTWLDTGELKAVVMAEGADRTIDEEQAAVRAATFDAERFVVADAATRAARACPVCSAALRLREYPGSGVAIDECAEHGIWLSAGELERIEAYGEAMRHQSSGNTTNGSAAGTPVRGIALPAHVLAALTSSAQSPPPGA